MWRLIFSLLLAFAAWGQTTHPILAVGSPAPDFSLPGVDGRVHRLADYAASPVLVVVFTCNHCPIAQMYEERIQQLETDYRHRGLSIDGRHGEAHAAKGLTAFGTSLTRNRYF